MLESSKVSAVLWCSKHVTCHKIVITTEFVQVHSRTLYDPNKAIGEPASKYGSNIFKTPVLPLKVFWVARHDVMIVLKNLKKKIEKMYYYIVKILSSNVLIFIRKDCKRKTCIRSSHFLGLQNKKNIKETDIF